MIQAWYTSCLMLTEGCEKLLCHQNISWASQQNNVAAFSEEALIKSYKDNTKTTKTKTKKKTPSVIKVSECLEIWNLKPRHSRLNFHFSWFSAAVGSVLKTILVVLLVNNHISWWNAFWMLKAWQMWTDKKNVLKFYFVMFRDVPVPPQIPPLDTPPDYIFYLE